MRMPSSRSLLDTSLMPCAAAVETGARILRGEEEQVAIDRRVALLRAARRGVRERRRRRVGDVPDLEAAEVALVEVLPAERHVGVRERQPTRIVRVEHVRLVAVRDELHPLRGDAGVIETGLQADARVVRRGRLLGACGGRGQRRDGRDAEQRPQDHGSASVVSCHGLGYGWREFGSPDLGAPHGRRQTRGDCDHTETGGSAWNYDHTEERRISTDEALEDGSHGWKSDQTEGADQSDEAVDSGSAHRGSALHPQSTSLLELPREATRRQKPPERLDPYNPLFSVLIAVPTVRQVANVATVFAAPPPTR